MRRRLLLASLFVAVVGGPFVLGALWPVQQSPAWREWSTRQRIAALIAAEAPRLPPGERTRIAAAIARAERRHDLDPLLLVAVIERESRFDARARGPRGGIGLMQLRPATARHVAGGLELELEATSELFDPRVNVALGAAYLARMKERFGTWEVALVAYNAGPTRVDRALRAGRRPRSAYSRWVIERWKALSRQAAAGADAESDA